MKIKVVFHLDMDEETRLIMALNNISNLLKEVSIEDADIFLVANGVAVRLLSRERAAGYAQRIGNLSEAGVRFLACSNSLSTLDMSQDQLLEACQAVPAGIVELIRLQSEGCAYVKP